jgi:hypothetical protein
MPLIKFKKEKDKFMKEKEGNESQLFRQEKGGLSKDQENCRPAIAPERGFDAVTAALVKREG